VAGSARADLSEFMEQKGYKAKIASELENVDVKIGVNLGDVDIINGINVGLKARHEVEPSYLDQYYTRLDKYTVKGNINVGDLVKNAIDIPFNFSVNRENTFYFVRQFPSKKEALKALPYSPARLPVTAERALKFMDVGDFVSMPANLSVAVEARAKTSYVAPIIVSANAGVYWIVTGEFNIQVFRLDERHVRLKMISKRAYNRGANGGIGLTFDVFGVRVVDKQLERLVDKDFVDMGYEVNPGEQFIVDYIFDLGNPDKAKAADAQSAFNQILRSTVKFKDLVVLNKLKGGLNLKDKLISSFEEAEKLFEEDKNKANGERRVSRVFKGFNDFHSEIKRVKLAFLLTSYKKEKACTENKVTFIDKNENNLEYFYPTCSKYVETSFGKWMFDLKDQDFQNNFGLIPKVNHDEAKNKDPDFGLNYERRDKAFRTGEQRIVQRFLLGQMPKQIGDQVNLGEWKQNLTKKDSKITFQLTLKSQGFNFLRSYSEKDLTDHLRAYYNERKTLTPVTEGEKVLFKLKKFFHIGETSEERIRE
ncbi:MAG: hypothetical protein K2Q18_04770, partial [Bdellovibrionales bacterium]|nr:hypothetical protein [Bdellovibrionales bacterium]